MDLSHNSRYLGIDTLDTFNNVNYNRIIFIFYFVFVSPNFKKKLFGVLILYFMLTDFNFSFNNFT